MTCRCGNCWCWKCGGKVRAYFFLGWVRYYVYVGGWRGVGYKLTPPPHITTTTPIPTATGAAQRVAHVAPHRRARVRAHRGPGRERGLGHGPLHALPPAGSYLCDSCDGGRWWYWWIGRRRRSHTAAVTGHGDCATDPSDPPSSHDTHTECKNPNSTGRSGSWTRGRPRRAARSGRSSRTSRSSTRRARHVHVRHPGILKVSCMCMRCGVLVSHAPPPSTSHTPNPT